MKLIEIRCTSCGKMLGEANLKIGIIKIKCKCGVFNTKIASALTK